MVIYYFQDSHICYSLLKSLKAMFSEPDFSDSKYSHQTLRSIIKEKWANGVGGEFTGHKVWQMNYFKEHTTDQAVFEGKISKSRLLSLVILLSFQTCMIVCIETPSVLISNCEDILVINIIS